MQEKRPKKIDQAEHRKASLLNEGTETKQAQFEDQPSHSASSLRPASSTSRAVESGKAKEMKHLRRSAPIQGFKTVNAVLGFSALVGAVVGYATAMFLFPEKYLYIVPWPSYSRIMPPALLACVLLGILVGMTIAVAIAMLLCRLMGIDKGSKEGHE